ncbi:MAG: shikimate dehydrogenase [Anaerolineaceae bacterium]|nr:shikimate dehydrogenase [Anaerolineaceae bacterium]
MTGGGTQRVGIIGWPLGHTLSPAMHRAAFQALGMTDWRYDALPIPPDQLGSHLRQLRDEGGYRGLNVTIPLKEAVLPFVEADETAAALGAVNTIDFRTKGGHNTDVGGLLADLAAHELHLPRRRTLILGAGGAARAAVYALAQAGAVLAMHNRTVARAERLIAELGAQVELLQAQELATWRPQLVVNCTSVGMMKEGEPRATEQSPWPAGVPIPTMMTVYDMVYRPARTKLMAQVEAQGGRGISGLGMLVQQGALSFAIWTGREAPVEVMRAAAERDLYGGGEA